MRRVGPLLALVGLLACGDEDPGAGAVIGATQGDAETPPTGADAVDAWLAEGHHLTWACEDAPHPPRDPSAHGENRICSNSLLSDHGDGPYPLGAASVKELFEDGELVGHAVTRRVGDGAGEGWYWFERIGDRLVADGAGDRGKPADVCVGCHQAAGRDAEHPGHDLVYTQVR